MNMAIQFAVALAVPLALSLLLTPLVIRLAHLIGAIDRPNERKAHTTPMPRLGGVAVSVSFAMAMGLLMTLDDHLIFPLWLSGWNGIALASTLALIVGLGIRDDIKELKPLQKFLVQLFLASIVYLAGFHVSGITDPFGVGKLDLGPFDYLVTVLWIVGITNAVNLIDGLDGLASGVSAIALLTMVPIALLQNDPGTATVALILSGAVLGFLRYNYHPARIFLGDSGSLFLGFLLAILSLQSSTKSSTAFAILVPIISLGLPIMDTVLSMLRRFFRSFLHPEAGSSRRWTSMFTPDRGHIHHQLMARGLSHRHAVLTLYLVSCVLGIGALSITVAKNTEASLILGVVGVALVLGVRQLRYREIAVFKNGVLLPLFEMEIMNRGVFLVFLDIVFIIVSYGFAHMINDRPHHSEVLQREFIQTIAMACFIQFMVIWARGTYRSTTRGFGLSGALNLTKTALLAVALCGIGLWATDRGDVDLTTLVLDFYLLISLMGGSRLAFRVLRHLFKAHNPVARRILIYGANREGILALQRLLESDTEVLAPAGFLDDRPSLEGRHLDGYPVFGGHWKLERVVRTQNIKEVILSSTDIKPEILRRLLAKARDLGLVVRSLHLRFDEVLPPKREVMFSEMSPERTRDTVVH
jgi:UDP-GlcNAc:undecaprenyl-phosphate/decaprenyl-phosphate GlcNAc-1-phosphate transferase